MKLEHSESTQYMIFMAFVKCMAKDLRLHISIFVKDQLALQAKMSFEHIQSQAGVPVSRDRT
jgi:hypothetical protein